MGWKRADRRQTTLGSGQTKDLLEKPGVLGKSLSE